MASQGVDHENDHQAGASLTIGFVGLGVMGQPMASHLVAAGHRLLVKDLQLESCTQWAATQGERATVVPVLRDLAVEADIVITMLPNGRIVQEVCFGDDGLANGLRVDSLLLDTSSSEPWLTRQTANRLADIGVAMVDAAVSGAQWGAQEAALVVHLGPIGSGHKMKCTNNLITAVTFGATAEGLAIGKASGLDPEAMLAVLNESTGMSWVSRNHIRQRILSRQFDDPYRLELMLKDMGIATTLAREHQVPVPQSALAHQLWQSAIWRPDPARA